jgi:DNA-binding transcriptional LysR family regulator
VRVGSADRPEAREIRSLADFTANRLDAGLRIGEKFEQDMIALSVSPELRMAVVASPDYLAVHDAPETPQELNRHRCIGYRMRAGGSTIPWEFERDGRDLEVKIEGSLIVNEPELAVDAALDGLGLAYVLEGRAAPFLADGRLVRLLADWTPPFPGFFLYYPSRRHVPPTLAALIAILRRSRANAPA